MNSRVALVTGGTGGIGTAICKRLVDMGHRVATNYRNEEKALAWQQQMREAGYEITLVPGDVGTPEGGAALVRGVSRRWGRSRSWSTTPASPATPPSTA
jgi:Dehydrogenases with different specificities (related to short-chain alcohol dehydrogenases)